MPSILLRHEPRDLEIAEEAGINFQISGHTHMLNNGHSIIMQNNL